MALLLRRILKSFVPLEIMRNMADYTIYDIENAMETKFAVCAYPNNSTACRESLKFPKATFDYVKSNKSVKENKKQTPILLDISRKMVNATNAKETAFCQGCRKTLLKNARRKDPAGIAENEVVHLVTLIHFE